MQAVKKILMGVAALGALAFGGAQIAGAAGGSSSSSDSAADHRDAPDKPVTGSAASSASTAATKAVGGGTVKEVERSDEGGKAAYEVKVDKAGKLTEVTLGQDFSVLSQKADDDQAEHQDEGDGDGENPADDVNGADAGDGDGENPNQ